jgi:hypothetical protein
LAVIVTAWGVVVENELVAGNAFWIIVPGAEFSLIIQRSKGFQNYKGTFNEIPSPVFFCLRYT